MDIDLVEVVDWWKLMSHGRIAVNARANAANYRTAVVRALAQTLMRKDQRIGHHSLSTIYL